MQHVSPMGTPGYAIGSTARRFEGTGIRLATVLSGNEALERAVGYLRG